MKSIEKMFCAEGYALFIEHLKKCDQCKNSLFSVLNLPLLKMVTSAADRNQITQQLITKE